MKFDPYKVSAHEAASILIEVAHLLRREPDVTLRELRLKQGARKKPDDSEIPGALAALVALSDIDKSQWQKLIEEYRFPIAVRPRDASRDILGKLLKFLEQDAEARKRLQIAAISKKRSDISPELMNALTHLLK